MNPAWVRYLIEAGIIVAVLAAQRQMSRWLLGSEWLRGSRPRRLSIWAANAVVALWLGATLVSTTGRAIVWFPRFPWLQWNVGLAISWAMFILATFPLLFLLRRLPPFDPGRRSLLLAAQATAVAAPLAVIGFGVFVSRKRFELRQVDVAIPGLAKDLDGLRLAQLTDIHLGAFLSRSDLARAVAMANETRPHVALVTGDFISIRGDPLEDCLRLLAGMKAEAGVFGCLGNHEVYAHALGYTVATGARLGIEFLRGQRRQLRFGGSILNLAGVDYLQGREPAVPAAGALLAPGAANVLLSHNPNAFPSAASSGFDLTVSGHTHGGQVTMEVMNEAVTLVRFFTPYVQGLFRDGPAALYVSRGIGTVGVPARIGSPPEVTLIRLCAI
jgi:predicted MPP superfamily phosphohydrolase